MRQIHWFADDDHDSPFPPLSEALLEPNGLLAAGGPLSPTRLIMAYRTGIFPWFSDDQPVLWWSPDPRAILLPGQVRVPRSLRKRIRNGGLHVTLDRAFDDVISACAGARRDHSGTWLSADMQAAYRQLHRQGYAHSVETWAGDTLVGGLYGVAIGRAFFGESMFSHERDASKLALVWLAGQLERWGFPFIDCQVPSGHLARMGATLVPRSEFARRLAAAAREPGVAAPWAFDPGFHPLGAEPPASM